MLNHKLKYKNYKMKYLFLQNNLQIGGRQSNNPFIEYDDWDSLIDPQFPSKFEEYEQVNKDVPLGSGVEGTVFLVKYNGVQYALKKQIYHFGLAQKHFHEAKLLRTLSKNDIINKYCCKTYSVFIDNSKIYHLMEYVGNLTLDDYIEKNKNMTKDEKYKICVNLASGLYILHSLNVVHKDIKPPNIIYHEPSKTFKFIDFGISCQKAINYDIECFKNWGGSKNYMAPEMINAAKINCNDSDDCVDKNKAIDIWALGVLFYNVCYNNQMPYNVDVIERGMFKTYIIKRNELLAYINKSNKTEIDDIIISMLNENIDNRIKIENLFNNFLKDKIDQKQISEISELVNKYKEYTYEYNNLVKTVKENTNKLYIALENKNKPSVISIISDPNIYLDMEIEFKDYEAIRKSAMVYAVEWGDLDVIKSLINDIKVLEHYKCEYHKSRMDIQNPDRMTPLMIAIKNNNKPIVEMLLSSGTSKYFSTRYIHPAILDGGNSTNGDPLAFALSNKYIDIAQLLLNKMEDKYNVNGTSPRLRPIFIAFKNNYFDIVKQIISNKQFNIERKDENGNTILHIVVINNNIEFVKILLDNLSKRSETKKSYDYILDMKNNEEKTAFEIAKNNNYTDIKNLLESAYSKPIVSDVVSTAPEYEIISDYIEIILTLLSAEKMAIGQDNYNILIKLLAKQISKKIDTVIDYRLLRSNFNDKIKENKIFVNNIAVKELIILDRSQQSIENIDDIKNDYLEIIMILLSENIYISPDNFLNLKNIIKKQKDNLLRFSFKGAIQEKRIYNSKTQQLITIAEWNSS